VDTSQYLAESAQTSAGGWAAEASVVQPPPMSCHVASRNPWVNPVVPSVSGEMHIIGTEGSLFTAIPPLLLASASHRGVPDPPNPTYTNSSGRHEAGLAVHLQPVQVGAALEGPRCKLVVFAA
jgi:hypothetical protein